MPEAFDTGPLSWVKDEIDQSFKKVLASFNEVNENPSKFASLRFTITHLYQVSGALDMVGLEGCKRYCSEIEKLTNKLEKQIIPVSQPVMAQLIAAVDTLSKYLQDLLNGMPDIPTKLFPSLKPLVEAQGESLEESELFFPDIDLSAPKNLPANPIEESAVPIFVSDQRVAFQKALLEWLRTGDAEALSHMRTAISNVQQVQYKNAPKTLWWTATAFADALAQDKIAVNAGAKKLCRKLDSQLRNMSLGDVKAPSQLLRDLLYYIAISDASTDVIANVKALFELDDILPMSTAAGEAGAVSAAAEIAVLAQLTADLPSLKDLWSNISVSDIDVNSADLNAFISKLEQIIGSIQQNIANQHVVNLFNATYAVVQALQSDQRKINETSFIEVAASLNLLEQGCDHYSELDAEMHQKMNTQISRLQSLIDGIPLSPAVDAFTTSKLDSDVVSAVAKQIIDALSLVEKSLDAFFRHPSSTSVLNDALKPLQQVSAAFDMLEMPVPKAIAHLSLVFVERFQQPGGLDKSHDTANFELVAESLSMLGLYAEELPNVRVESVRALSDALLRLKHGAQVLNLAVEIEDLALAQMEVTANQLAPDEIQPADEGVFAVSQPAAPILEEVADRALDAELQDIFLTEAEEVIASLAQNLQILRVNATNKDALIEVRRAYHTLKGSGRTVGLVGMGEVAWAVERLLNLVMEHEAFPTPEILAFVEKVSAEFSTWVDVLQQSQVVTLNPAPFQAQAAELAAQFELDLTSAKPMSQKEEVVIGGTRKISRAFFNIFLGEAQQHLEVLQEAQCALVVGSSGAPSTESCRAAHTLGSNALTAGFKPIGDLARALEGWFEEHNGVWTEQHVALYGNVVKALEDGLTKAKALKNPKSTRALVNALSGSTAAMQAAATKQANADALKVQQAANAAKKTKPRAGKSKVDAKAVQESEAATIDADLSVQQVPTALVHAEQAAQRRNAIVDEELLALFVEEARELAPQIGKDLRGWRAHPQELEYPDSLQRILHTLKGSARMAGQDEIGDSVHSMEDHVIRALRQNVSIDDFDAMFVEFDRIAYMLEAIVSSGIDDTLTATPIDVSDVKNIAPRRHPERKLQYLRMRADVLDRLINEAGEVSIMRSRMDREMQNFKQSSADLTDSISRLRTYLRELEIEAETQLQSRMSLLQEANETFDPLEFDRFTRLQELTRMMAESVNDVATVQHSLLLNLDQTDAALQQQNRMNRELQQGLMGVRMLPFATVVERLQRIVRQTARELNKRVEMTVIGEGIELDRGVLDKIGAPLEHLLRNAVAHGIESTEDRIKSGKPEIGHIKLKVSVENDEISLDITDDGAGINLAKVKQQAIGNGLFASEQEITDQALMMVIFEHGFTTAETVSQISGRGVGLDVVRSDIAALGGRIDVNNISGSGAMFNIHLPVTLSVAQVVLAKVGNQVFAIPSVMVEQVQKLKQSDLINAYQANKIDWAGREYPLHYLSKLIGDTEHVAQSHIYTPVILLRSGAYRTALHVDEVVGNQEVVMKPVGTQLARVPGILGATVLGDGAIILLINPVLLANREVLSVGAIKATTATPIVEQVKKIALVVDDSLTMRKVLSRVLEREDFEVVTANDGMDAIQKLQETSPDIILTDIEMPRMDGFEFSRYVRDNEATSQTPLIIISSRTAEKHRNVATELGVNAFLGKPVQDEELMEQVNALLKL